ncbi:MAG: hypothetical protein AAF449_04240 [Myxococcota bacterium]
MSAQLSKTDLKAIEAKIADVEKHTAGEIVVHVVKRSDDYTAVRLGWSIALAAVAVEIFSYAFDDLIYGWTLEMAAGFAFLLWLVLGLPALLRRVIPMQFTAEAVHKRAKLAFLENRVYQTRDASGVLIMVSLFERRVEILADEGIHARVGVEGWTKHVRRIIDGMKTGQPAEGIIETIGLIGEDLKSDVPIKPDDENELSNEVIISDR